MKISAPIIAIMAASSSVASAKVRSSPRSDEGKNDLFCPTSRVFLAVLLARSSLQVLDMAGYPIHETYGGDESEPLEPEKVALSAGLADTFDHTVGFYDFLLTTDTGTLGNGNGMVELPEIVAYYSVPVESLTCLEVRHHLEDYRSGLENWLDMIYMAMKVRNVAEEDNTD